MNPGLILCRIQLEEVESQMKILISSIADGDRPRAAMALSLIQQARQALSDSTDSPANTNE
jgi:hypothetical protein